MAELAKHLKSDVKFDFMSVSSYSGVESKTLVVRQDIKEDIRGKNVLIVEDILDTGKVLICDELENSLHESVISQVVQMFQTYAKEPFAQLIFTTHDTSLLDTDLFRRDQVWFTQLNQERATDLYSLVEIRNVRKTENLEKGYVSGKYGAIPMLNKQFFHELEESMKG